MDEQITFGTTERSVRAVLYKREELPEPVATRVAAVEQQLEAVAKRGNIESVEVRTWCSREPLQECSDSLQNVYSEFALWAATTGRSLTPFFSIRRCYTTGKTERCDWLVLPALCLALYEDDTLRAVYPHLEKSGYRTVEDGLAFLEEQGDSYSGVSPSPGPDESAISAD